MELQNSRSIQATPEEIWQALMDADILKACVPGCEEMTGSPDEGFEATVVQKVGPVKATFKGAVTLTDRVPPKSLTITGEGQGGVAGFASGSADVVLRPDGQTTHIDYTVQAKVGGKLAQLGSRVIDSFAKKMADQFFDRLQEQIEAPEIRIPVGENNAPAEKKSWFKRMFGR